MSAARSRRDEAQVVTVLVRTVPYYRLSFFERLRLRLAEGGIELRLIYGQPSASESSRRDTATVAWGRCIRNRSLELGSRELFWQPALAQLRGSGLVIVEQASKLLINYLLVAAQYLGGPRFCLWGHGRNRREHDSSPIGEALKRVVSRRAHWWFAYTESSAATVRDIGFPAERITVVQNAVDSSPLYERKRNTSEQELVALGERLSLFGRNVAIYAGGLYEDKRIPFLLEAARGIRARVPDFELIVLGGGPQQDLVERAAREEKWLHYEGPKFAEEKVPYFMLAKLELMPGAVGLAVNDAFVFETPLVTVDDQSHGPEIEYLVNGENGSILAAETTPSQYAGAVARLLGDESSLERLRVGCRVAARRYSMEAMVERFAVGVEKALGL